MNIKLETQLQQTEQIKNLKPHLHKILESHTELFQFAMKLNEDLKTVKKEFQDIVESLPHGLIVTDIQGKILHFNKAVAHFTKISSDKVKGKYINKVFQTELLPKDFLTCPKNNQSYHHQFRYTSLLQETKDLSYTLVAIHSDRVIIHIEDITLVNKLKKESDRKNRLITMGKMAATIAHEVRNPLASIKLFASMLAKEFKNDKEKLEILSYIQQSVKTANYTISNLLQNTIPVEITKSKINIGQVLEKFYKMNEPIAKERGYCFLLENLPKKFIEADEELINQVLSNLFNNGLQALEKSAEKNNQIKMALQEKQDKIYILFEDQGCGMTAKTKGKIFQPFHSTKTKGIGLGMSVVKNIMDKHKAQIFIESKEYIGTKICLEFFAAV